MPNKSCNRSIMDVLDLAADLFKSFDIDSPSLTAEILLALALDIKRIDLYLKSDNILSDIEIQKFDALVERRIKREPVAYITGVKEFWGLDIKVNKNVLIPRPETEILVQQAVSLIKSSKKGEKKDIIDLGTGSGAIVIALASVFPEYKYTACDISLDAVLLAKKNADIKGLKGKIDFLSADWLNAIDQKKGKFDMIISNPPYIPSDSIKELMPEVSVYEPKNALDGGVNGLESISFIIKTSHSYLKEGGYLLLEIGFDQKDEAENIIRQSGLYYNILFTKDYSGIDRVISMKRI